MPSQIVMITLFVWFLLLAIGGVSGFFAGPAAGPPAALGLAVIGPALLFVFFYAQRGKLYRQLQQLNLRVLVLAHVWRVLGLLFIIDYYRGLLPAGFAFPAGIGDIVIAITAPFIAYVMKSDYQYRRGFFVVWNALGILDLIVAVTLGILYSESSFGILAGTTTTALMAVFPRNLVPTFLVPLFVIFHIIALSRNSEVATEGHSNDRASAITG